MIFLYFNSKQNLKTICQKHTGKKPAKKPQTIPEQWDVLEKNASFYKIILEEIKPNSIQRLNHWY